MRNCLAFTIAIILLLTLNSCKTFYFKKFDREKVTHSINLDDYNTFVLSLCESKAFRTGRGEPEELPFSAIENCPPETSKKIVEQLYLLLPKDSQNKTAIYITSFSHKYLYENYGVFNCPDFKDKFFVEDIDNFYFGTIDSGQTIKFENGNKTAFWNYSRKDSVVTIESVSLPSKTGKQQNPILVDSVFPAKLHFLKRNNFKLQYGKGEFKKCFEDFEEVPENFTKEEKFSSVVTKVHFSNNYLHLESEKDTAKSYFSFKRKRITYFPQNF
jgi:hypothetical protein